MILKDGFAFGDIAGREQRPCDATFLRRGVIGPVSRVEEPAVRLSPCKRLRLAKADGRAEGVIRFRTPHAEYDSLGDHTTCREDGLPVSGEYVGGRFRKQVGGG